MSLTKSDTPTAPATQRNASAGLAWYRYPLVWLVFFLPFTVVIASIYTYILIHDVNDDDTAALPVSSSPQDANLVPAIKARNHAQSSAQVAPPQ